MKKPYFVMLFNQEGDYAFPLQTGDDEVAFYATMEEARAAAKRNFYGENFGFEIFCMGQGED